MPGLEISTFYNQIRDLSEALLQESTGDGQLKKLIEEVVNHTETEAERSIPKEERDHMDCRAGCAVCCRVHVPVLRPEALSIASYLRNTLAEEELEILKQDMKRLSLEIKTLDEIERIFANKKCAFLSATGECSIYPVRPLLCRSVTSANVNACRESIRMIALDQAINIPMNIRQKSLFDTAFKAMADALQRHGFPGKSSEITSGVLSII